MFPPPHKTARRTHTSLGYSLTELAIVLAIIGLVAGMTLSVGKVQLDVAEWQGSKERLETVRDALLLFQKKYERYPCPTLPADSSASATYGQEISGGCAAACPAGLTCDNSAVIGAVPFKTLKLNEEMAYDSWDGKITYVIDNSHTQSSISATGSIPIVDANGNEITASPVFGDAIFALVSHGRDGNGAYGKNGALIKACGTTAKDIENCNGDPILMDSRINNGAVAANYFDDYILWQTQETVGPAASGKTMELGELHSCAKKSDGTAWCWGANWNGNLGDGTTTESLTPVQVAGLSGVAQIGAEGEAEIAPRSIFSCALQSGGTVWCWGKNDHGELGDNTTAERHMPVQIAGLTGVTDLALGGSHGCAVKSNGTAWCWGLNEYGQLGDNSTTDRWTPTQASGLTGVINVSASSEIVTGGHSCALRSNGTVWCWGKNDHGELGDGTMSDRLTPVQVAVLSGAISVSAGSFFNCALKNDGTVWCWGDNPHGELGDGTTIDRLTPVQVSGLTGIVQISAGQDFTQDDGLGDHSCALKSDGTAWCWGMNDDGELGDNSTTDRYVPGQVSGLTGVEEVAAGDDHSCARKTDGTLWCWGLNTYGQLGDNTTAERHTPVQVLNFP